MKKIVIAIVLFTVLISVSAIKLHDYALDIMLRWEAARMVEETITKEHLIISPEEREQWIDELKADLVEGAQS